jgi:hypothetical protein
VFESLCLVATVTSDDVGPGFLCLRYRFIRMFDVKYTLRQIVIFGVETIFVFCEVVNCYR